MEIPTYGEVRKDTDDPETAVLSTLSSSYIIPQQSSSRGSHQKQAPGLCNKIFEWLNVDAIIDIEDTPSSQQDTRLLMKQITQMKGVTKAVSVGMIILSLIYLWTRIESFVDFRSSFQNNPTKYERFNEIHLFTIVHSVTCLVISVLGFISIRKNLIIDRRQYYFMLGVTTIVSLLYFAALLFIVIKSSVNSSQTGSFVSVLDSLLDLVGSISINPFAFFFALVMNFILIYGIFTLNLCSMYLADLSKALEQKRTGGRQQNEVELNSFTVNRR